MTPKNHSVRLGAWGPYTKKYIGISHVPDERAGFRFDLSVFPGLYRRRVDVPSVLWESGYHPWETAADLRYFSFRHEIEWKDRVYADVAYARVDDHARLVRARCVNHTDRAQSLVLHYLASIHPPPPGPYSVESLRPFAVRLPPGVPWIKAVDYEDLRFARPRPNDSLVPDGFFRGEVCGHGFVGQSGLGQGFGRDRGDTVTYRVALPAALPSAALLLRYRVPKAGRVNMRIDGAGAGTLTLEGNAGFQTLVQPLGALPAGVHTLAFVSEGGGAIELDGFAVGPAEALPQVVFEPVVWTLPPERLPGPRANSLILKYADVPCHYGLAWNCPDFDVREFRGDDIDWRMRFTAHNHVQRSFAGDEKGHYTDVFLRPIAAAAQAETTIDALVCEGTLAEVQARLAGFDRICLDADSLVDAARAAVADPVPNAAGEPYRFSQRLMAATALGGVVYPVYTQRQYIKHYSPGRWWDCLYTWDSGFVGLGLAEHDLDRAADCLDAYVTDPGNPHAAFIHHGSPVPTQMFLFQELWNRAPSPARLEYFYPRLRQYYLFLAGKLGSSTTATLKSGLLRTWDYFYNTGWDDYPPQVFMHAHRLADRTTCVNTTALVVRSARILRMAAAALGRDADLVGYDEDIDRLGGALQRHAWDDEAGYFGWVTHDAAGAAAGLLHHASGANFNMGIDGVAPLFAGLCTPAQVGRCLDHLRTPGRLWSPIGLTSVDQTAPYYRRDGYWNGTVWMPHQWMAWKTMLDLGEADFAWQIARTGLDLWRAEVDDTYHCFEHFVIETGRGAGWHQFTGLSSPVMSWFAAYFRPGRLTCGLDAWVERERFADGNRGLDAEVRFEGRPEHRPCVLVCLDPGRRYACRWNDAPVPAREIVPGCWSVAIPAGNARGRLVAEPVTP